MIKIYSDAAYNPKTKEAGIGIQIMKDNQRILNKLFIQSVFDNHLAEFMGLISALNYIESEYHLEQTVLFYSDSKILIDSIEKRYSNHGEYQQALTYILDKIDSIELFFPQWIPEANNKGADHLAKQALRTEGKLYKSITEEPVNYSTL